MQLLDIIKNSLLQYKEFSFMLGALSAWYWVFKNQTTSYDSHRKIIFRDVRAFIRLIKKFNAVPAVALVSRDSMISVTEDTIRHGNETFISSFEILERNWFVYYLCERYNLVLMLCLFISFVFVVYSPEKTAYPAAFTVMVMILLGIGWKHLQKIDKKIESLVVDSKKQSELLVTKSNDPETDWINDARQVMDT